MDKFSPCSCTFNELADIAEVDQFGVIDLRSAYVNGCVPENITLTSESFNNIDDAGSLLGRPSDVFDAIRKAEYVSAAKAARGAEAPNATPNGENE